MLNKIIAFGLCALSLSFADRIVMDNSMAAAEHSDYQDYEDRGSFGPYVEFNNIKMSDVKYVYKVHNQDYKISIDNSYIYGASGTLPLAEWFDVFIMAGYQYLGISHHPKSREKVNKDLQQIAEFYLEDSIEDLMASGDSPISETDIDGRHQVHTALFQIGFDLAWPLVYSYNYQFMLKPYAFASGIVGKTFFSDDTQFLSPILYGYAYGAGIRMAWHGAFISAGVKNGHEYFHTYFERKTGEKKEGDEFMLDFDTYFQPFITLGITLF